MSGVDFTSDLGKRALERLGSEEFVWLTTVNAQGAPAPTPVWFLWQNDAVVIYSRPGTGKIKAIQRGGNVSLNFNADEQGDGNVVVIQGTAELVPDRSPATANEAYMAKYRDGLTRIHMTPESFAEAYSELIRIVPASLRGW